MGEYDYDLIPDYHPWNFMSIAQLQQQLEWYESDVDGGINGRSPYITEILYVNGIQTDPTAHRANIRTIERTFKRPVTGIYNLTEGRLLDAFESGGQWLEQFNRVSDEEDNPAVIALEQQIQWQFNTDKSYKGDDFILTLVGHSQGALITYLALIHLSENEGWWNTYSHRIQVYTLGGAAFGEFPIGPLYHHYAYSDDPITVYGTQIIDGAIILDYNRTDNSLCDPGDPLSIENQVFNSHSLCAYFENIDYFQVSDGNRPVQSPQVINIDQGIPPSVDSPDNTVLVTIDDVFGVWVMDNGLEIEFLGDVYTNILVTGRGFQTTWFFQADIGRFGALMVSDPFDTFVPYYIDGQTNMDAGILVLQVPNAEGPPITFELTRQDEIAVDSSFPELPDEAIDAIVSRTQTDFGTGTIVGQDIYLEDITITSVQRPTYTITYWSSDEAWCVTANIDGEDRGFNYYVYRQGLRWSAGMDDRYGDLISNIFLEAGCTNYNR
jgi:hypothetical protein